MLAGFWTYLKIKCVYKLVVYRAKVNLDTISKLKKMFTDGLIKW